MVRSIKMPEAQDADVDDALVVVREHGHGVVELCLARTRTLNALNQAMYHRLIHLLDEHSERASTRIVVLSGAGRTFTSGMDIREANGGSLKAVLDAARSFMDAMLRCKCIIIAAVFGEVTGIGVTLLLHCDIVFSEKDATFTTPFYLLGIIPEFASSRMFPMFLGPVLSSKLLIQGRTVTAQDMYQAGAVQFLDDKKDKLMNEKKITNIGDSVVEYAVQWSSGLNEANWFAITQAKKIIRDPIRNIAQQAMETEFDALNKLEKAGVVKRLLASRVQNVKAGRRRRAML